MKTPLQRTQENESSMTYQLLFCKNHLTCVLLSKTKREGLGVKIHSVILLIPMCLCNFCLAIQLAKLQLDGPFRSNTLNRHNCMPSRLRSIRLDFFQIHVTSDFNVFFNRHFDLQLITKITKLQSQTF